MKLLRWISKMNVYDDLEVDQNKMETNGEKREMDMRECGGVFEEENFYSNKENGFPTKLMASQ